MKRSVLSVLIGLTVVTVAFHTPTAIAQGRGGGKKGPTCEEGAFPATLSFEYFGTTAPAVYASEDGTNGGAPFELSTNFTFGNIAGELAGDGADLPLRIDFARELGTAGRNHYNTYDGHSVPDPSVDPSAYIDVDPWVSTAGLQANDTFDDVDCDMFGMELNESYRMRLTIQWWELDGVPVRRDQGSNGRWVLKYKPFLVPNENITWLNAVRVALDTWVLTTRTNTADPTYPLDPLHEATLERTARGKGKNKEPESFSQPGMPFQLVIKVQCGDLCQDPGSGS